ncbi:MAG: cytochrome c [Pseudomonadota bacterium]
MRTTPLVLAALTFATTLAAHQGVKDPDVMARMNAMTSAKDALNTLGNMAKGEIAFDPGKAEKARKDLARIGGETINLFAKPAQDPKSEALPLIWVSYPDFTQRALNMNAAFNKLDVSSLATLRAGLPEAGATCLSCHQSFRKKTK